MKPAQNSSPSRQEIPAREPDLFRLKLLRSHAIFSILTALLVALVTFYYLQKKLVENSKEKLHLALESRASMIERSVERGRSITLLLSANKELIKAAAQAMNSGPGGEEGCREIEKVLDNCLETCPGIIHASLVSSEGRFLGESGLPIQETADPDLRPSRGEIVVGDPCLVSAKPHIVFHSLLNGFGAGPQPELKVCLHTPDLLEALYGDMNLGKSSEVQLGARRNGSVTLFTPPRLPAENWQAVLPDDRAAVRPLVLAAEGQSRLMRSIDYRDKDVLSAFQPVKGTGWGLAVKIDIDAVRGPVWKAALLILFSTALLVALSMFLALKRLGPMADIMVLWSRELEKKIRSRTLKLKKSEEMYRILADSISDGALILRDDKVMYANKAFRRLVGFPDRGYEESSFSDRVHSDQLPAMKRRSELRQQGITPEPRFNSRLVDRGGKSVPVEVVEKDVLYGGAPASLLSVRDLGVKQRLKMYESVIPTCAVCHSVRDDSDAEPGCGAWLPLDRYLRQHSDARMSHTYCPRCEQAILEAHNLV